jgi:hypothetical protein
VKSVSLTAPSLDFTVSGSPVTGTGTLSLNWVVPPSTGATPYSIVKRDDTGSIFAAAVVASNSVDQGMGALQGYSTSLLAGYGVYGESDGTSSGGWGVYGTGAYGGVYGNGQYGVYGYTTDGYGVYGDTSVGWAGWFNGDVRITGSINPSDAVSEIDHPLDPANKYLRHTSVESSERMNIYTGNITTDDQGGATVQLPDWFEALNTDYRYQLTVIGQFAQAIVSREIQNHEFHITTSLPNVKVSWQVTGVRQDAYAKTHPLQPEKNKPDVERGFYLHPELYGASEERGIPWAHDPQGMKQRKEARARSATDRIQSPVKP